MSKEAENIFGLRIFQLDLARHPRTPESIRRTVDLVADCGYNALAMYLEGMVRTESFHLIPEDESYSPKEIGELVEYAAGKGVEAFPVVSMLGHAELFLQFDELEPLAELRDGVRGRFSSRRQVFCASSPAAFEFICRYVSEVAALFPSPYFHAGFDEAWDIGYCPECRRRLAGEGQAGIFLKYLLDCHRFLTGVLHKRMMIWDDMFEIYGEVLPRVPKDIVLCAWHYERTLEMPGGHVGAPRRDVLAVYERLGLPCLFAPHADEWRNVRTYTDYVVRRGHRPLGAFLTSWGDASPLWLPVAAAAGRLWSEGSADPLEEIRRLSGESDPQVLALLRRHLEHASPPELAADPEAYLKGALGDEEYLAELRLRSDLLVLDGPQEGILREAAALSLGRLRLYFRLRHALPAWYGLDDPESRSEAALRAELEQARTDAKQLRDRETALAARQGSAPCVLRRQAPLAPVVRMIETLLERPRPAPAAFLVLRIPCTPDRAFHGSIALRLHGEPGFRRVWKGSCSQTIVRDEFQQFLPVDCPGVPEEMSIETDGLTGTAIAYAKVVRNGHHHVPRAVSGIRGRAETPEALLADGRNWCTLGEGDQQAYRKLLEPEQARQINGVELLLQDLEPPKPEAD